MSEISRKFISFIEIEDQLIKNAVLVAKTNKSMEKRIEELREIYESFADEDNSTWFCFSVASIVFESIDWKSVITHFGNYTVFFVCIECGERIADYDKTDAFIEASDMMCPLCGCTESYEKFTEIQDLKGRVIILE